MKNSIPQKDQIVTIKNNDTEWTFSGNDIKDAKNIDTSVSIYKSNFFYKKIEKKV